MTYDYRANKDFSQIRQDFRELFTKWRNDGKVTDWDIEVQTTRYLTVNLPPEEKRVIVRWTHPVEGRKELSCARFDRVVDNAGALFLTIDGMRMGEKRLGSAYNDMMREAYLRLPAPTTRDPWEVLGLKRGESPEVVTAVYRAKAKTLHPDLPGGDAIAFKELSDAYAAVKASS